MTEYAEIFEEIYKTSAPEIIDGFPDLPNVICENAYYNYNWNLIAADPDDNKFVDCAIRCNADYIVTNDGHFKVLSQIDWPKCAPFHQMNFWKF